MENLAVNAAFWKGRRVLITGHTGFKGSWLCLMLQRKEAVITGYALNPPTQPNLFDKIRVCEGITSIHGDVRDFEHLRAVMQECQPEVVFHLAAQPLVGYSYENSIETYATNVMGTVHVLEAVRCVGSVRAVVVVTSDKCYENQERQKGYREGEPMGGYDPYSSSKGCAELVTAAYRRSFFDPVRGKDAYVAIATARAGNVIGGGDFADRRLIPDVVRAWQAGEVLKIRYPDAVRPWQHVLDPLHGYVQLAERLWHDGPAYAEGWNFGPDDHDAQPVRWIVETASAMWGADALWALDEAPNPHEAHFLRLDCIKARERLEWQPRWDLHKGLRQTMAWYQAERAGEDMHTVTLAQIADYESTVGVHSCS